MKASKIFTLFFFVITFISVRPVVSTISTAESYFEYWFLRFGAVDKILLADKAEIKKNKKQDKIKYIHIPKFKVA